MSDSFRKICLATTVLVVLAYGASVASAEIRSSPLPGSEFVNVNVAFTMELPLPDESEKALTTIQTNGRRLIYEFAKNECTVMKAVIANACRLTNLQISTQIRRQQGHLPVIVYLNGNARFAITLKRTQAAAE